MAKAKRQVKLFASLEEVGGALNAIARSEGEVREIERKVAEELRVIRELADADAGGFKNLAEDLRERVQATAQAHPEWFAVKKSVELPQGRFGWRLCPPMIKLLKKVETVIAALRCQHLQDAIIVKETVNKDVLAAYDDALLKGLGAKRFQEEVFFIELPEPAKAPATR